MSRFVKSLALFVAGLHTLPVKAFPTPPMGPAMTGDDDMKGVSLQPLNGQFDNLFAGHSSHSSHRSHSSHSSHYSGSGGYSSPYTSTSPSQAAPSTSIDAVRSPSSASPLAPGNSGPLDSSSGQPSSAAAKKSGDGTVSTGSSQTRNGDVEMSKAEKLHLQVFRVQLRLNSLGLFSGQISGKFDDETKRALRMFQQVKGLPENGLMTTPTLNALGIPAVK